jgi:hypothetical protein
LEGRSKEGGGRRGVKCRGEEWEKAMMNKQTQSRETEGKGRETTQQSGRKRKHQNEEEEGSC